MEFQYVRVQSNHISSSSSKALRRRSKLIFPTRPPPPPPEPPPEAAFSNMPINACSLTLCTRPACAARRMLSSSARAFSGFTMAILLTATEREERRSDAFGQSSVVYFALTRARRERRRSRRSRDEYARLSRAAGSKTLANAAPRRSSFSRCLSLASSCSSAFTTPSSGMSNCARRDDRRVASSSSSSSSVSRRRASRRRERRRRRSSGSKVNSTPSSPLARLSRAPRDARRRTRTGCPCMFMSSRARLPRPLARARRRRGAEHCRPTFTSARRHVARGVRRATRSIARRPHSHFSSSSSRPRARRIAARASTGRGTMGERFHDECARARRRALCRERRPTDDDARAQNE